MRGNDTRANVCRERWARLLQPLEAAVYAGFSNTEHFKASVYGKLIRRYPAGERVDRYELDKMIGGADAE